jgi:RHS repeat-associated protein
MMHNFFLRDHLGNTRVQLKQNKTATGATYFYSADTKDYYAFGLEHGRPWDQYYGGSTSTNPYLYNGKEMDRMHGLNQLDYGARWYDASLGRWGGVIDPLCEKHPEISPFVYCANNPINLIDPDGMDWYKSKDGTATKWREGDDKTYTETIKGDNSTLTIEFCQMLSDGTSVCWNQNQLSTVKEQPVLSQKELSPAEKWSESDNFIAKLSYNMVNDLYVTSQGFNFGLYGNNQENPLTGGRAFSNLDGTANYEPTNSLVSTIARIVPSYSSSALGTIPKGLGYTNKLNAAQFSKTFKGSLSKFSSSARGFFNRNLNKGISWYNNQVSNGMGVLKTKSLVPKEEE